MQDCILGIISVYARGSKKIETGTETARQKGQQGAGCRRIPIKVSCPCGDLALSSHGWSMEWSSRRRSGCGGRGDGKVLVIKTGISGDRRTCIDRGCRRHRDRHLDMVAVNGADSYRIYRSMSSPVTRATGSLIISDLSHHIHRCRGYLRNNLLLYYDIAQGAIESDESQEVSSIPVRPAPFKERSLRGQGIRTNGIHRRDALDKGPLRSGRHC